MAKSERLQVIEQIYGQCPDNWVDVRHYTRPDDTLLRMKLLRQMLKTYPVKKRLGTDRRYLRTINEFRLLKAQLTVLSIDGPEDADLYVARAASDLLRGKGKYKDEYTLILMNFVLAKYDLEELRQMLERMSVT